MTQLTKQDLESLLRPRLGKDLVVESFTSEPLTQPGENYGSTMVALEVNVVREEAKEKLSLVAKLAPPSEFIWRLFDSPNTFCKEINTYTEVKVEFEKLQKERGIPEEKYLDVFPRCYGARTSLSQEIEEVADKNAVLLLENLKSLNYSTGDRRIGLDIKHVKLAITRLARFHALSVALKILKPKSFKQVILKASKPTIVGFTEKECWQNVDSLIEGVSVYPECKPYVERIKKRMEHLTKLYLKNMNHIPKEPWAAFIHTDFWVNNMLFGYDSNNILIDVKFVDFQGPRYSSPVKDLIFFLYSSTADGVRDQYYDSLVKQYHENFTEFLNDLGCDTTIFTFQSLLTEINEVAPLVVDQLMFMLRVICADKKDVKELAEVSSDSLVAVSNEVYDKRVKEFILDFVKRGWL